MRPEIALQIGHTIRALRTGQRISVTRLADLSGVSRRMLTQVELGQANPSLATIDRLASALGTTFADLVGATGAESPEGILVRSTPGGSWARLLTSSQTPTHSIELWRWHLVHGDRHTTTPDPRGPDLLVHILQGVLHLDSAGSAYLVRSGESMAVCPRDPYVLSTSSDAVDFVWVATLER